MSTGGPGRETSAYVTSIDSLRAIAVVSVMVYHMHGAWLPGGFAGVDIFFVISGYVISRSMVGLADLGFATFAGTFYSRRIRRIVPALVFCLLTTTILTTLFIPHAWLSDLNTRTGQSAFWGFSNFTLMKANDHYFEPRVEFNPYAHTWSLGVEEQFYVLFPTIFYLCLRFRKREDRWRWVPPFLLSLLFFASLCYSAYATRQAPVSAYYGLPGRFWELASGGLLFQLHDSGRRLAGRGFRADSAQLGLSAAMMFAGLYFSRATAFPFPWALPAVLGTLGAIDLLTTDSTVSAHANSWLNWAPSVWIGKLSYSLYLWHWPVYVLLRWTVGVDAWNTRLAAIGTTLLLAWGSYVCVENPIRRGPLLHKAPPSLVVAGGLCCVFLFWHAAQRVDERRDTLSLSVTQKNYRDWYPSREPMPVAHLSDKCQGPTFREGFLGDAAVRVWNHGDCNPSVRVKNIFVTGNSHVVAYEPLLSRLARFEPFNVQVFYHHGCTFLALTVPMAKANDNCKNFYKAVLADITSRLHPGDIVFLPSLRLPRFGDQWAAFSEADALNQVFGQQATEARQSALEEADKVVDMLVGHGAVVIFEAPKPIFRAPAFRCSDWFNRRNPLCSSGLTISRDYLLRMRKPVLDSMDRLSRQHDHVYVWDPLDTLCPTATCEAVVNGMPLFVDSDHLSAQGNRVLYSDFVEFLRSHS